MKKKTQVILAVLVAILMINIIPSTSFAADAIQVELRNTITLSVPGNKAAKWISSNSSIATVTQKGKVTGKKLGYVLIVAETSTTAYYWRVRVIPGEIIVYTNNLQMPKGISKKESTILTGGWLYLYLNGIEGIPTWTSSNKNVATVTKNGAACEVTGKKEGKTTITATLKGKKYTCKVTVYKKTLYAKPTSITIDAGKKKKITVRVKSKDAVSYSTNTFGMIDAEWGKWNGDTIPLTIEGLKGGKTILTIRNDNTAEEVNIKVKVNKGKEEVDEDWNDDRYDIDGIGYDDDEEEEEEDPYALEPNAGKEYKSFYESWITEERLEHYYGWEVIDDWTNERLGLVRYNKDGNREELDINNFPRSVLKIGTIYEGIYKDTFTIRFQRVSNPIFDGKEYYMKSICLNIEDLKKAGIIE